jgi:uroporphyrinogen decarboxylase
VDAAILFADILLPLIPLGIDLEFAQGEGPVIHNPVRSRADVDRLRPLEVGRDLGSVFRAVEIVRGELAGTVALIGFAGAPFTLASYLIEGGSSRDFLLTKQLMLNDGASWHALMGKLSQVVADYLVGQVRAGAQAVQLFDSWVGALGPDDYREFVQPYSARVLRAVAEAGAPAIHFGTGTSMLLEAMRDAGGEVIGVDWRIPLDAAWDRLGPSVGIQGNLDPASLFALPAELERRVVRVLEQAGGRPGHIFNLGHGVLPGTPVKAVRSVVEMVHAHELHPEAV